MSLPYKHENMRSTHIKKNKESGVVAFYPSSRRWSQEDPQGSGASQPPLLGKFQVSQTLSTVCETTHEGVL